jgi:uncharacterized SAM-binding protein YcdF (DUF218 family)
MLFILSKLFWVVAQPSTLLLLILACGVLWLALSGRRRGFALVAVAAAGFVAADLLPVADLLLYPLEGRFSPPAQMPGRVAGIVLLGGAINTGSTREHGRVALNEAAERITGTAVLARQYPEARVVVSGGSAEVVPDGSTEADAMRSILVDLGIPAERILVEGRSRNTIENAEYAKQVAQPRPGETWLLVTSAMHMPRSMGCFRHVGWDIVAYPVNYRTGRTLTPDLLQLGGNLAQIDGAMREWVGLVAYRLLGRTDALLPSP